jgi:hypothetical protein
MKTILILLTSLILSFDAFGFEIYALGTSNTNCKNAGQTYTNTLNELLSQEKINATVVNAGVDGDKPHWMMSRLEQGLKAYPDIRIVIFEPGPNEKNKKLSLEPTEVVLAYLQKINMASVYVSHSRIQTNEEAQEMANKYGAFYYGHWNKNVPTDKEHRQYDDGGAGHMTAKGCQLWAQNMFPLLIQVIKEKNLR